MKTIYNTDPNITPDTVFTRTPEVQKAYDEHIANLKAQGITPEEYILQTEFLHPSQNLALTKNNYPYDVPYKHLTLWVRNEENINGLGETMSFAASAEGHKEQLLGYSNPLLGLITLIALFFPQDIVVAIFRNPIATQSVPGIRHYHVFLRNV